MTALQVRRPPWDFDDTTPFQWNAANPQFGIVMNGLSFISHGFEKFLVAATRAAMREIDDPEVLAEADAFLRQEAAHAAAHHVHTNALVHRYPGLKQVLVQVGDRFDHLLRTRPLDYQLAYSADIEATFTPLFNLMLRNRESLFDNGDPRVAPLFIWHLVEEIEHRSSAQIVYDAVVPSKWYRLRVMPSVFRHMIGTFNVCCRGFDAHVPESDRGMHASDMVVGRHSLRAMFTKSDVPDQFASVPRRQRLEMTYRLARSQWPGHSPATEETPPFADEWIAAYNDGRDVVRWYDETARAQS